MEKMVEIGNTGVRIPRIFTGGWRVEEKYFGAVDREGLLSTFAYSFFKGLPHNTAIEYGNPSGEPGRAERWAGEAVRRARIRDPVVFTKYGYYLPLLHGARSTPTCHPDSILEDFGGSRERLGFEPTGWIMHHYDKMTPAEDVLLAIRRLHHDGRVKVVGLSHAFERAHDNWKDMYDLWWKQGLLHVIEQGYYLAEGRSPLEHPQIAYALDRGLIVTSYSMLGTGLLSPRVLDGQIEKSDRKYANFFEADGSPNPAVVGARKMREKLQPLFESWGLGWMTGLINFAASMHAQIVPIIGIRIREHVDDIVTVLDHLLSSEQVSAVNDALKRENLLPGLTGFLEKYR